MLFGNDALFSIARSAKRGIVEMPPVLSRLRDWISAEYGVSVVYVSFDHIDIGPHAGSPRLTLILETDRDDHTWKTDVVTTRPDARHRVLPRPCSAHVHPDRPLHPAGGRARGPKA